MACRQFGFLTKFADGGLNRWLVSCITKARRQFHEHESGGVSVLAQTEHAFLLIDCQHDDRPRVFQRKARERVRGVLRARDHVLAQRHHPGVTMNVARGQDGPGLWLVRQWGARFDCHLSA